MHPIPPEIAKLFRVASVDSISYLPASRHLPNENESFRMAAVAIVIYRELGILKTILTLRSAYIGHHSGQVSFPGGKFDDADNDLIQTARRECYEEIGIDYRKGVHIGKLENLYIPVSGFLIEPHLFFHETLPELSKNEREVAELIPFELTELINTEIKSLRNIIHQERIIKNTAVFHISGHEVWGATAILLEDLRRIILVLLESESSKTE
jgi:8-oxo-dGTP pyrophosphatase MutT (NUDIX family)